MSDWKPDLTAHWERPRLAPGWRTAPYGRQKAGLMSDLTDIIRHVFTRFGRPHVSESHRATDANMELLDHRLGDVEERQRLIAARLRLLEIQSDPQGRLSHE